jgi:hypothetical protein
MIRRIVAASVLLVFLPGCCSTEALRIHSEELEEANSTLEGRRATITTVDGARFTADGVHVTPETVSWVAAAPGEGDSVPTREVASIRVTWRAKAAAWSLLFLGGAFGLLFAVVYSSDSDEPYADAGVLLLPLVGALIGVPMAAGTACRTYDLAPLHTESSDGASDHGE